MTALTPLKKHGFIVIFAPMLKLFECACELAVPFIVRYIIDDCLSLPNRDLTKVLWLGLLMVGLAFFGFGMTMITQYMAAKTSNVYAKELRTLLYDKMGKMSSSEINSFGKNKVINLFSDDAKSMQNGVAMFMRLLFRAPFVVTGSIIASFFLNITAGILVASSLALCSLVLFFIVFFTPKFYLRIVAELDKLGELAEDGVNGNRLIKSFRLQQLRKQEFNEQNDKYQKLVYALLRINALINPLTFLFVNAVVILVCYFGSYQKSSSGFTVGDIVAVISYLSTALATLVMFARLTSSISKALSSKKRIDEFFAYDLKIEEGEKDIENETGPLFEFRHVGLDFGGASKLLDDVSFVINEGESVGIFGGTGAGKSLCINLLLRFLDPTSGNVLYKGNDIKNLKFDAFRNDIALVSQKKQLFSGSIKENIAMGKDIGEDELNKALKLACCDFVFKYEDSFNHQLTEAGNNLSGGQKQRLMLARAIASNRDLLILDDSTSALDYATDKKVRKNIASLKKTTLIVSQRPSSLKDCGKIIVLDHGHVVGVGSFDELAASCEIFRNAKITQEAAL